MPLTESNIAFLEKRIPELADGAIKQAYVNALASGCSVLVAKAGKLIESQPDGSERILKSLPATMKVRSGKRTIRKYL